MKKVFLVVMAAAFTVTACGPSEEELKKAKEKKEAADKAMENWEDDIDDMLNDSL